MTKNSCTAQPSRRNVLTTALGMAGLSVLIGTAFVPPPPANDNNPTCSMPPHGGKQRPVYFVPALITRKMGITAAQYGAFREGVAAIENARYDEMGGAGKRFAGRYQFGRREIRETAEALGLPAPSTAAFLNDPEMQERFFERYTLGHHNYLMRHNTRYAQANVDQKLEILARAHNEGAAGASSWLETGVVHLDGFGTNPDVYAKAVRRRLSRLGKNQNG
ncbi:hypothetical protein WOA01_00100 [Methylocystis sp. IM2]|uniref:hypothetical protein n=1 Tax=unclassified Methylocystis TaxID=2625913 RepID=UPI0030F830FB